MLVDKRELRYKGTQVAYYVVCKRKLWLFSKGISYEHTSEWVALGKFLDEQSFKRQREDDFYEEPVRIDFITTEEGIVVHEIKHSTAIESAHFLQVKYYLYYLRSKGLKVSHGVLHYPKAKKIQKIYLTEEDISFIEKTLTEIDKVLKLPKPLPVEEKPYCKECAYFEFCYG